MLTPAWCRYPNTNITGGINPDNALQYLDAGASHVIVTSYVFRDGTIDFPRLEEIVEAVGKEKLVIHRYSRAHTRTHASLVEDGQPL